MAKSIVTWVEGLKGLSGIVIVFNHLRMCFWPESHDAISDDGHFYLVQLPFVGLICAGNLAVRLFFVLSGFSLCYRPLQLLEEDRNALVYQRTSKSLQSRFWRLLVPSAVASAVSLVMAQLGAFTHSKTVCRAFLDTTPIATSFAADIWLWIKDTFLDMWIAGKHHFHDSLWCMKVLLVGSYLMYLLVALRVEARHSYWLWTAIGCALLSPAVASLGATDLAGFVFGGIVAFVEVNIAAAEPSTTPVYKRTTCSAVWFALFILSLLLGSYPSGEANAPWCSWMYTLVRSVVGIENARQAMVWWMNVSAFLICICISHLPYVQNALSLPCVTYLGKTSFALFLLHPLILRSLGGHLLSMFSQWHGLGYDIAALIMVAIVLVLSLIASHFWNIYVEGKAHKLVEKHLILESDAGPALVK